MKQLNLSLRSKFSFKSVIYFVTFQLLSRHKFIRNKKCCNNRDTTPKI